MSLFNYRRRPTRPVRVGGITVGGDAPVRLQSMCNTPTVDTAASVAQTLRIVANGGEIVRLTTQGVREAANMAEIKRGLREVGCEVPLVADVHFNPKAAFEAATTCDKVRINPGNFVGAGSGEDKIPFLDLCKEHHTAVRLGVNHGSLSPDIMERYGDTPEGMVESALQYLRICREENFHDVVISIKSSNVVVMTQTVRLLAERMAAEGMDYPLHLGVTEAGDGEDGRVKSAVGIGSLLAEGLGDTIRVSLSEDPEDEIPVAAALRDHIAARNGHASIEEPETISDSPLRDKARRVAPLGETTWPLVEGKDYSRDQISAIEIDASQPVETAMPKEGPDDCAIRITSNHVNAPGEIASWIERYYAAGGDAPVIIKLAYDGALAADEVRLRAAADFGVLLLKGYGNALELDAPSLSDEERIALLLGILQACRLRISKTEYISCPSCGRTLFDLQKTLAEVKKATAHLVGLKIGVMGCIVNGPGEMADADYGYVGAGPGRVSIYKGKTQMLKNIPAEEALDALLALIEHDNLAR